MLVVHIVEHGATEREGQGKEHLTNAGSLHASLLATTYKNPALKVIGIRHAPVWASQATANIVAKPLGLKPEMVPTLSRANAAQYAASLQEDLAGEHGDIVL